MNRKALDAFVEHHRLDPAGIDLALRLADARPTPAETSRFAVRALMLAGVLSLAAGVVFFVAANWDELRVAGRFVLLEILLLACVVLAFLRPPPQPLGRYGLLGAFVTTGALLALFGQTYQTGADVYELFLTWTVLALPFVLAGQWSVLWAAWVLVLNIALGLFCGFRPDGGPLWILFSGPGWMTSALLSIAALLNLALWALAELAHGRLPAPLAAHDPPNWLRRLILACGIFFATWAGCLAITSLGENAAITIGVILLLAGVAYYAVRRRIDVFPLALVAASGIVLGTAFIAEIDWAGRSDSIGIPLLIALWLVISSTASGRVLMHLIRRWRPATEAT